MVQGWEEDGMGAGMRSEGDWRRPRRVAGSAVLMYSTSYSPFLALKPYKSYNSIEQVMFPVSINCYQLIDYCKETFSLLIPSTGYSMGLMVLLL